MTTNETSTSRPLNAKAIRDTTCTGCSRKIVKGERCSVFRERALTSHEAMHAGLYPQRRWCAKCAGGGRR